VRRRLSHVATAALLVGAAAACAVLLNVLLLGAASAQNDPVGRLTPHAHVPAAPAWVVRPSHGHVGDRGADD
jgi:hypothetical protein